MLIENKLQAGSKQQGQLLRYYETQVKHNPEQRVCAVYLAPGAGLGASEVRLVRIRLSSSNETPMSLHGFHGIIARLKGYPCPENLSIAVNKAIDAK